ncbi:hypothetical protein SAMN06265173_1662 [Thalassovita litoralis]|jgi:hypothetical protein|uniref:Hpr(Ser) kinase/phosphatase n=1 Tax=Thalassovita litoralis TaxID=1010611 RepID=A0A521FUY9_9RHOB|nr:hypothetical protein [Thalassovita litoralis]SMO99993.1 hypothetical protein SAMN06265173_1662 [Thalassovita litoralis]
MSPVTGAVVLTNAFGQAIAKGIGMGLPPDELAARLADRPDERNEAKAAIQSVLAAWEQAGLLTRETPDFPDPVAFSGQPHTMPLRFSGPGGVAHVYAPDPVLSEQLETIMGHMTAPPRAAKHPTRHLIAQPDTDGFAIFRNGAAVSGRIGLDAARFVLMREVAEATCGPQDVASVFHAGCVALNGQALLISGESGQGKSTLTFGLVAAGCAYLGDDHVPLCRDGRQIMSFPTSAGVKPGSWKLPEIRALQDRYGLTPRSPREGVRYIPLQDAGAIPLGQALPVKAIVIPHYRPDAPHDIMRISPEQALIQTLKAGCRTSESHQGDIAPLTELLNHVPAYELRFSRSDQSVPTCLSLLQNPLP